MSSAPNLSEHEFSEIEEALASTSRGRAFLRMRDRRQRVIAADEVKHALAALKTFIARKLVAPGGDAHIGILRRELQEMGAHIQRTRSELASLRAQAAGTASGSNRINLATEELDEIVRSTERATSDILNAAERIMEQAEHVPAEAAAPAQAIREQATEIMTSCSFQDLTGQRITKIVNTLRYLEQRVTAMIDIWGLDERIKAVADPLDTRPDAHLLNGPSRPGEGRSQVEIDAILSGIAAPETVEMLLRPMNDGANDAAATRPTAGGSSTQTDIDRLFGAG